MLKIVTKAQIQSNMMIILNIAPRNVDSDEYFGFKIAMDIYILCL